MTGICSDLQAGQILNRVGVTEERRPYVFSAKSNASKEIESWARGFSTLGDATMRGAGQLADNVTEARMLRTKVMDMSKERYKYKTQADYGKRFFLDAQKRKTKLMPELLKGVDCDYWLSSKSGRHVPTFSGTTNARLAFLDRLESTGEKCKDFLNDAIQEPVCGMRRPPEKTNLPEFYRIRLKEEEEEKTKQTVFPTQPILRPVTTKAVSFCVNDDADIKLPKVAVKSAKSLPPGHRQPDAPILTPAEIKEAKLKRAKSGCVHTRSVNDPRYQVLENSLSQAHSMANVSVIQNIIDTQDSLHTPSKLPGRSSRPKVRKEILEYLRARGII